MKPKRISLSMWGYQRDFRKIIDLHINNALKALGVTEFKAECFLVGTRIPTKQNRNPVCIEPEDGKWGIRLFNNIFNLIEEEITNHHLQNINFIDEQSVRYKEEKMYRDSVPSAVEKAMRAYDSQHCVQSFAGSPAAPVNDHYVTPVIQLPNALFERFRPFQVSVITDGYSTDQNVSLIHATVLEILNEAYNGLLQPNSVEGLDNRLNSTNEIIRRAALSFMTTLGFVTKYNNFSVGPILESLNMISSLMYEGTKGVGKLLLSSLENGAVDVPIKFATPIPFDQHRWSRKVLQLVSSKHSLIASFEGILGLGHIAEGIDPQNVFQVDFLDHYHWRLCCGDKVMLVSKYGIPSLPQERFSKALLLDTYERLFPESCEQGMDRFIEIWETAVDQHHGSMLVVAKDAESEARRLESEGTRIEPVKLTRELYQQVSRIDGAVIVDSHGICHAIGVILDGKSDENRCTPSRGARYNSAVRYVYSSEKSRLAIVASDDQTIDIIPLPRFRIKRSELEKQISRLEASTFENYHQLIKYLDDNRFYLDQVQCDRINQALERMEKESEEVGKIRIICQRFSPNLDFNESYYKDEGN